MSNAWSAPGGGKKKRRHLVEASLLWVGEVDRNMFKMGKGRNGEFCRQGVWKPP